MTPVETLRGQSVALFGLGGSGLSTARALIAGGAEVAAWDDSPAARERAAAAGVALVDLARADWRGYRLFVLAPGVPLTHPKPHWTVNLADEAGVPIVGDVELFARERGVRAPDAPFVAITGTNGKSTTTALIAHVLEEAGREVAMGGNIGVPILDLPPPAAERIHVVECSSYQIDLAPSLAPSVGLLINITPDHLDRHGDLARYAAIKERLVAEAGVALVGVDDEPCREIYARLKARVGAPRVVAVSGTESPLADVWVSEHRVIARAEAGPGADLARARALRGAHNGQNAAFAYAAASALGVEPDRIAGAFETFPGLAHRMEEVGRLGRVLFINDSKATNADAAGKALMSFRDIHWILGGRPKAGGIEPLRPLFPRVAKAYLIGEASDEFARTLAGAVPFERCGTLSAAAEVGGRGCGAFTGGRARGAAFARLRVVRSVHEFRGARRRLPGLRRQMARAARGRRSARAKGGIEPMVSRVERGPVADWMRTADRWLIGSFVALMVIGLVMALAASPAVAERLNLSTFHFVNRQAVMLIPTVTLMIATSFLSPRHVRRAALMTFVVSFTLVILALMFGVEVKGARRWIFGLQPSEFIKPAFVVLAAWAFTEGGRTGPTAIPAKLLSFLILPITIVPLILEPDFGQTMLVAVVWTALFFLAGLHWFWVVAVGGMGMTGGFAVFKLSPHVHERVLRFLDPDSTGGLVDTFQVDTALQSILSGGWFGRGPGEGVYEQILPDAHTDFVFAVAGEEFGMIACMALIAFFAFIVLRALVLAARSPDPFCRLAAAGLTVMFAVQSWINIAVNLRAMPAKGMTLPFISYGGSSLLALGLGMGFLIALTRKRPAADLDHPAAAEG